jgi:hypothetical protein
MCYITKFFKNYCLEVELKICYKVFVYLENLEVEGFCYCSWRLKVIVLKKKVEGSCSYF